MSEFIFLDFNSQFAKAKEIFQMAKKSSRFYAKKYKNIDSMESYDDWLNIPFLTREEIFNNTFPYSMDMVTKPLEDMIVISTGGSSGIARFTVFTHPEWDMFVDVQAKALKVLGITKQDIVANLFVAGNMWSSFLGGHDLIKKIGAVHLPISAIGDVEKLVWYLEMFKPTVILSVPTMFVFIADYLIKHKKRLDSVRMIQYVGEHLSDNSRKHIKNAFGDIEIKASGYTSADCGLIGYECLESEKDEYHIATEVQFIEIYDFERDRPCDVGETGEIVVTSLSRTAFPIVRYRIGDVGYIKKERCSCGDRNPLLMLKGRAGEDFKLGSAFVSMDDIEKSISDFVSVDGISANYSVKLDDTGENLTLTLSIECSDIELASTHAEKIRNNLRKNIKILETDDKRYVVLNVKFVELGALPRSPITGKVKKLVDKRVGEG